MIKLDSPEYLWLLLPCLLLIPVFTGLVRWKKTILKNLGNPRVVKQLIYEYSPKKFLIQFACLFLGLLFSVISLSGLTASIPGKKDKVFNTSILVALDVSNSMKSLDESGKSRLEAAKNFLYHLSKSCGKERLGLVLFAGDAMLQLPITNDYEMFDFFVNEANPSSINQQGSDLNNAISMGAKALKINEALNKVILLISDGEYHENELNENLRKLSSQKIIVQTIGVGSIQGSAIPEGGGFKKNKSGKIIISHLNENLLKEIASKTNGTYKHIHKLNSQTAVSSYLKNIRKKIISQSGVDYRLKNLDNLFLSAAVLLIIASCFISEKKSKYIFGV